MLEFIDRDGQLQELTGRLAGSGQGIHALELPNGTIELIPQAAVRRRIPGPDPEPVSADVLGRELTDRFGKERFLWVKQDAYLLGIVLQSAVDKAGERRAVTFLKKAARFMKNVESVFLRFARDVRFELEPPRYPLVVLVFESDTDFEKFAVEATGGLGMSPGNIAGFYSSLTNYLHLRLSECHTFETPLHEAIHQQIHNRGILQRLAPVPVWFNEGIATGFEGNSERINIGPTQLSRRYARMARMTNQTDWASVIADDRAFRGDILAGEAYTHAWSLHWLLVTEHRVDYMNYVRKLGQLEPLADSPAADRLREFTDSFGNSPEALQAEFAQALETAIRRQKFNLSDQRTAGISVQQIDMGEVRIEAVSNGGLLRTSGRLKNISPIRPLAFRVIVLSGSGAYAEWLIPELAVGRTFNLPNQTCNRILPGARGGPASTFQVFVLSAPVGSVPPEVDRIPRLIRGR